MKPAQRLRSRIRLLVYDWAVAIASGDQERVVDDVVKLQVDYAAAQLSAIAQKIRQGDDPLEALAKRQSVLQLLREVGNRS